MRLFIFVLFLGIAFSAAAERILPFTLEPRMPRKISLGKKMVLTLKPGNFEIVVSPEVSPAAKYAAEEIAQALSQCFSCKITPVRKASGNKIEIRPGDLKLAKSLGIDVAHFDRDGFVIRTAGKKILIAGRDDFKRPPLKSVHYTGLKGEWATLFGAYDFLERFAGVRYYFTGPLGTHHPKLRELRLPEIDIYDRPDFLQRRFADWNYAFEPQKKFPGYNSRLIRLRTRMETVYIPNCHGIAKLGYQYRFGKNHPEYFALHKDGKRLVDDKVHQSQICFSSPLREEIIADAISFLRCEPASKRGIMTVKGKPGWNEVHTPGMPCFNMMPNDSCYPCTCSGCWPHFSKGEQATTDFIWSYFNHIARKVRESGVPGYLTTMAYANYRQLPTQKLEDNILVMLALRGPWNEFVPAVLKSDMELLKAWCAKLGQKTWLWTYPGKHYGNMPGIPHTTPRALAAYIKRVEPYVFGIFIESETDVQMFNYLTYYIFGKMCWNTRNDVEKLLSEHAQNMFGPAAAPMKEFFDRIERNWGKIGAHALETPQGPKVVYPSELILWNDIYSEEELKTLTSLLDRSMKLARGNKLVLERLKLMREHMLEPILKEAEKFRSANNSVKSWRFHLPVAAGKVRIDGDLSDPAWKKARRFVLPGMNGAPAEVRTVAKIMYDKENFYIGYECEEPFTGKMLGKKRSRDSQEIWKDSDAEIFISPDCDKEHYYQILVNPWGAMDDLEGTKGVVNYAWNSGAEVKTRITPGKKWCAEIRLPRKSMRPAAKEGILVNFARHRALRGGTATPLYCWSPFVRRFNEVTRFGLLSFKPSPRKNLIDNPDLAPEKIKGGRWWGHKLKMDQKVFISEGNAAKLEGTNVPSLVQYFKELKPETEYEVIFFVRLENVKKHVGNPSGFSVRFDFGTGSAHVYPPYGGSILGTSPWSALSFRVTTPKQVRTKGSGFIRMILRNATGTAWVDRVAVYEIGPGKKK